MSGAGEDSFESRYTQPSVPTPSSTPNGPTPSSIPNVAIPSSTPAAVNSSVESGNIDRIRKLTSPVWTSFKKLKIDGEDMAICNKCEHKLKANSKNGTKHLHKHLSRRPKREKQCIRQSLLRAN